MYQWYSMMYHPNFLPGERWCSKTFVSDQRLSKSLGKCVECFQIILKDSWIHKCFQIRRYLFLYVVILVESCFFFCGNEDEIIMSRTGILQGGHFNKLQIEVKTPISRVISPQKSQLFSAIYKGLYSNPIYNWWSGGPPRIPWNSSAETSCRVWWFRKSPTQAIFWGNGCPWVKKGVYIYI